MKKIFAFILATIMVVSLVPASVFAAITNDPGCPNVHTVKNCEYTELGEVDATCTDPSYTAYKCNKCGKQFADNFGTKANGHTWKDNQTKDNKNVAPNCAKEATGKEYVKCSVCGYVPKAADNKNYGNGYLIVAYEHNWVKVSGIGCETVYECSNSGCNHTKTDEHTWELTSVIKEPAWVGGKYVPGEALFTCKECKDTKTIEILDVDCKCDSKTLVQAAVAATCTEDGSYAIYKCDDCHQLYILVDKTYKAIDKMDSKDVIIPNKGGHVVKDGTKKTNGCKVTYTCKTCNKTIEEDAHPEALIETQGSTPATCTTYGYTYKLCKACGVSFVETHKPTGHNTATYTVDPTCATKGVTYTLCCNANCSFPAQTNFVVTKDGKTYNKIVSTKTIDTNDEHKPYVMYNGKKVYDAKELPDATCDMGVVYVWVCDNGCNTYFEVDQRNPAGHKMELTVESHNCAKATSTLAAWTTRIAVKCSACGVTTNSDYVNTNSSIMFSSKEEAEVFHGIAFKNTDAKGKVTYTYRDGKDASSLGTPISVPGNCTIPSYDIYTCPTCGTAVYVNTGIQGHVAAPGKDVAYKAATCEKTGTVAHSICALCDAAFTVENGKQVTLKTTVINKHGSSLTQKWTNCSKVSYWECTCGAKFTDNTASTSYTVPADAHNWKNIVVGTVATCNIDGVANVKYCVACNKLEVNRVYKNTRTGEIVTIKLAAETAVFEGKDITVTLTNGDKLPIKKNGTIADNKDNNKVLAYDKLEHTDPYDSTKSTIVVLGTSNKNADHTKLNYSHENCTFCDYEYLTDYFPATGGHVNAAGQKLTTKCDNASVKDRVCVVCDTTIKITHNNTDKEVIPATCVDEGYSIQYCKDCGVRTVSDIVGINKNNHAEPVGVEVNYAQNGYSQLPCAACGFAGKADKMTDKGIEVLISYDVNGAGATHATIGSIITITLDLASLNGVNVWGLDFALSYNPEYVEFIADSASFNQDSKFTTRLASDYMTEIMDRQTQKMVKVKAGAVKIAANADNKHISVKGSQNLVTLQFKVISDSTSELLFEVGNVDDALGFNTFTPDIIDETGAQVKSFKNGKNGVKVALNQFLDVDGKPGRTMSDALDIYTYILFNEYDAAADANADGKIDAEDLRIFYAILTGATTVEDFFKPVEDTSGTTPIQPRA